MSWPKLNGVRIPIPDTLRAIRHRNYRLLIAGQVFSLTGGWMQSTAQGWLVYKLTNDAFLLGLVGFAAGVPILALGLFAGAVVDSVNRHRLIIITTTLLMFQALVLTALTLVHGPSGEPLITFWGLVLLSIFVGAVQAFDMPARQTFLMEIVPKEDLGNAVALNSLTFNAARVVGPSLAGAVIALFQRLRPDRGGFGEGMCFLVNGLSFTAVILALLRMKVNRATIQPFRGSSERYLTDGLRYVAKRPHIRALLVYVGLMALFAIPYLVLLPVFAKDVLGGDSRVFGYLMTCVGVGAMTGGILLARRRRMRGLTRIISTATIGFAVAGTTFAWMDSLVLSCIMVALTGLSVVSAMITSQTVVQIMVNEKFRGRVMSLYTMMAVGLYPFGSLVIGAEAHYFGPRWALTINAAVVVLAASIFMRQLPRLRAAAHASTEYQLILAADANLASRS